MATIKTLAFWLIIWVGIGAFAQYIIPNYFLGINNLIIGIILGFVTTILRMAFSKKKNEPDDTSL